MYVSVILPQLFQELQFIYNMHCVLKEAIICSLSFFFNQRQPRELFPASRVSVTRQWMNALKTKQSKPALKENLIAVEQFPYLFPAKKLTQKCALQKACVRNTKPQDTARG